MFCPSEGAELISFSSFQPIVTGGRATVWLMFCCVLFFFQTSIEYIVFLLCDSSKVMVQLHKVSFSLSLQRLVLCNKQRDSYPGHLSVILHFDKRNSSAASLLGRAVHQGDGSQSLPFWQHQSCTGECVSAVPRVRGVSGQEKCPLLLLCSIIHSSKCHKMSSVMAPLLNMYDNFWVKGLKE